MTGKIRILFLDLVLLFLIEKKSLSDLSFCFEYEMCGNVWLISSYNRKTNPNLCGLIKKLISCAHKVQCGHSQWTGGSPLVAEGWGWQGSSCHSVPLLSSDVVTKVTALSCREGRPWTVPMLVSRHGGVIHLDFLSQHLVTWLHSEEAKVEI